MIYDRTTRVPLRAWLIKKLEPICDAEPGALADYVLALLEHEAPEQELRREFISQLEDFLEKGASDFVDSLFSALRSKSYVPYQTLTSSLPNNDSTQIDSGIPIPLDALNTSAEKGTKRSYENNEREIQGSLKVPRFRSDHFSPRQSQPNGPQVFAGDLEKNGAYGNRERLRSVHYGHGHREMLPKGVCRDYHVKGYCARGALCKYSHDDAAFAPAHFTFPEMPNPLSVPGGPLSLLPMYSGTIPFTGNPVLPYDPHEATMDMRPGAGTIDEHFLSHPRITVDDGPPSDFQGQSPTPHASNYHAKDPTGLEPANLAENPSNTVEDSSAQFWGNQPGSSNVKDASGSRENASHGSLISRPSRLRDNKTLVVDKVPEEFLSLEAVNSWFQRFGTVTNVAVDFRGGKALVSFLTHDEARLAWKAEEAIFNNRFVKIYWHRPLDGQGTAGTRKLQSSAPLVANLAAREARHIEGVFTSDSKFAKPSFPSPKVIPDSSSENSALVAKQQQLDRLIIENKELMTRLSSADAEEKKKIMTRLRQLAEEQKLTESESTNGNISQKKESNVELDAKSNSQPLTEAAKEPESFEFLQAKLMKLRAEAKALGVQDPANSERTYRMHRGRGKLHPYRATRKGGLPRFNMTLDNRPKALQFKGLNARDPEVSTALKTFYEVNRHLQSIEIIDESSAILHFVNRTSAEQAMAKGSALPSIGNVQISWHRMTDSADDNKKVNSTEARKKAIGTKEILHSPNPDYIPDDSEVGWNDPDDDGMGMF